MKKIVYIFILFFITSANCQSFDKFVAEIYPLTFSDENGLFLDKEYIPVSISFINAFSIGTNISDRSVLLLKFEKIKNELSNAPGFFVEITNKNGVGIGVDYDLILTNLNKNNIHLRGGITYQNLNFASLVIDDVSLNENFKLEAEKVLINFQLGYCHTISKLMDVGTNFSINSGYSNYSGNLNANFNVYTNLNNIGSNWFNEFNFQYYLYLRFKV